jgi:hypothetical protein
VVQALDVAAGRQAAPSRELSAPVGNRGVIANPGEMQGSSEKSVPLAPIHSRSPKQEFGEPQTDPASRPTEVGASDRFSGRPPLLSTEQPASAQGPAIENQSPVSDRDGAAGGDQSQSSRPTVSTLHIDGSALGRWTVQHLERALAKPSTGMTGVDPRATVPRNRVAPF